MYLGDGNLGLTSLSSVVATSISSLFSVASVTSVVSELLVYSLAYLGLFWSFGFGVISLWLVLSVGVSTLVVPMASVKLSTFSPGCIELFSEGWSYVKVLS